jgi:hypoxanthine-DNA glycosylase
MTLHSAIEVILKGKNRAMTTQEIANELNEKGLYKKKDGTMITAFQIHGRTRKYPTLFDRNGSLVNLGKDQKTRKKEIKKVKRVLNFKSSFEPITNKEIETLILGTLPGDKSIELQEYYGHARNRFWKIISRITNRKTPENYIDKKELLANVKIAIWDVAYKAIRKGSLDTAILQEEPNDLNGFIQNHPKLKVIGFNGKKAEALHDKYFERRNGIKYYSLPSSSPANAKFSFDELSGIWEEIMK